MWLAPGYSSGRAFLCCITYLRGVSSWLGLGHAYKLCEDIHTKGYRAGAGQGGTTHKEECKMGNPCSKFSHAYSGFSSDCINLSPFTKFSHANQPPFGTLVDYMYQNYGPENCNQASGKKHTRFVGQDGAFCNPKTRLFACSMRTQKILFFPEIMESFKQQQQQTTGTLRTLNEVKRLLLPFLRKIILNQVNVLIN